MTAHMKPVWQTLYTGVALAADTSVLTLPALFAQALSQGADLPAVHYLGRTLSYGELNQLSDQVAAVLVEDGFRPGDRLGLMLQNQPQFLIAALAAWKAGGIVMPINPMNRAHELGRLLPDGRPSALVVLDELAPVVTEAVAGLEGEAPRVYTTSAHRFAAREDRRVLPSPLAPCPDLIDRVALGTVPRATTQTADTAFIVYTSGTTGTPKGALITHDNVAWNAMTMQHWLRLVPGDGPVLGMAPLFHITGLVGGLALSWHLGQALVLCHRFHPEAILDALLEHRPAFAVGTITAYIALMNAPGSSRNHYASLRALISGGAATPPTVAQAFEAHSGVALHNGYGLTETTAGVTTVPRDVKAPVDTHSGALSVGVPVYGTEVWIAGEQGQRLAPGEVGEIVIAGRSVCVGYWGRPAETAETMRPDGFRSGDVGLMDAAGWVYLVDRKKDMINASGYKVWPREVEDVIYQHPAVREVAVIGVPDAYRGETVRAVVSLKPGAALDPAGLIAWCRERIAPYKVPREVLVSDELPKTPTGKILKRALRNPPTPQMET